MLELRQWLTENRYSQVLFAKMLGISTGHFNRVLKGSTIPSLGLLFRIEQETEGAINVKKSLENLRKNSLIPKNGHKA